MRKIEQAFKNLSDAVKALKKAVLAGSSDLSHLRKQLADRQRELDELLDGAPAFNVEDPPPGGPPGGP